MSSTNDTRPRCEIKGCPNLCVLNRKHPWTGKPYYRRWCDKHRRNRTAPIGNTPSRQAATLPPYPVPEPEPFIAAVGVGFVKVPYGIMRRLFALGPRASMDSRKRTAPGLTADEIQAIIMALFPTTGQPRYRV